MNRILGLFFITLVLFSCEEKREFLISEDKMVDVLVDIHIADGVLNTNSFPYDNKKLRAENYYQNILDQHHVSRLDFDSALSQYSEDRELYIDMYDKVIERLRTKESYVQANADSLETASLKENLFSYKFNTDYESGLTIRAEQSKNITDELSSSGRHSYRVKNEKYSQSYSTKLTMPLVEVHCNIKAKVLFKKEPKEYPKVLFLLEKEGKAISKYYYNLEDLDFELDKWTQVNVKTKLILPRPESDLIVRSYFFNAYEPEFFVDDFSLEIKQLK